MTTDTTNLDRTILAAVTTRVQDPDTHPRDRDRLEETYPTLEWLVPAGPGYGDRETMTTSEITRYIAHVMRPPGDPSADPVVRVSAGQFIRKPNSWRRIPDSGTNTAWDYQVVFSGAAAPGYASQQEAVRALLAELARSISAVEHLLAEYRADVAAVEEYLRGMDDSGDE